MKKITYNKNAKNYTMPADWQTTSIPSKYWKTYHGVLSMLFSLRKAERDVLCFMLESMNIDNEVDVNPGFKTDFNKIRKEAGQEEFTDGTIRNAITRLKTLNFISISGVKMRYFVNPTFFFKDSEKVRNGRIQLILETDNTSLDIKVLR